MKIVIADGLNNADYIIKMFKEQKKHHRLIVINSNEEQAKHLSKENKVPVFCGEPTKKYVLDGANIFDADLFIALSEKDTDNYISCMLAKSVYNVRKCICIVTNPNNVHLFKLLGIDSVISSSYLLAQSIKTESTMEDILKSLSIEDNILMMEFAIKRGFAIADKTIKEIGFPRSANISCVYRDGKAIIPNGETLIEIGDKLIVVTTPKARKQVIEFINRKEEVPVEENK